MTRALWSAVILLVVLGVVAATYRVAFPADAAIRAEPLRQSLLDTFGIADRYPERRAAELLVFDTRYGEYRSATLLHIVPGALFLVFAALQFSRRIRTRYLAFHRWSGRLLVLLAFVTGVSALFFALRDPFGGPAETAVIVAVTAWFFVALGKAVVAIRRRQVERHRVWMIRAFAVALGISVIRLIGTFVELVATPRGLGLPDALVMMMIVGWAISIAGAELWLRSAAVPAAG